MKKIIHSTSWVILMAFCILGLFYPVIGIIAIICMLAPSVYALIRGGRGWCGTYCPRGSFNDFILARVSLNKSVPKVLDSKAFRIGFLIVLMSAFAVQLVFAWGDLQAVGVVFVRMIIITTLITIVLGVIYKPRTWCHFCPMGTMAHYVAKWKGADKKTAFITFDANSCVGCKICSKSCPMSLDVLSYKETGSVIDNDCIGCASCTAACPKNALTFQEKIAV